MKLPNVTLIMFLSEFVLLLILPWVSLGFVTIRQEILLILVGGPAYL